MAALEGGHVESVAASWLGAMPPMGTGCWPWTPWAEAWGELPAAWGWRKAQRGIPEQAGTWRLRQCPVGLESCPAVGAAAWTDSFLAP